jgi:hypothetical protein
MAQALTTVCTELSTQKNSDSVMAQARNFKQCHFLENHWPVKSKSNRRQPPIPIPWCDVSWKLPVRTISVLWQIRSWHLTEISILCPGNCPHFLGKEIIQVGQLPTLRFAHVTNCFTNIWQHEQQMSKTSEQLPHVKLLVLSPFP